MVARPRAVQIIVNPRLLLFKFALFLLVGFAAAALILMRTPELATALLLGICVWAFARSYYFCFYVIEHYVDRRFRFSGVFAALRYMKDSGRARKVQQGVAGESHDDVAD